MSGDDDLAGALLAAARRAGAEAAAALVVSATSNAVGVRCGKLVLSERAEELLLLRPKNAEAGSTSVAEEGQAILDEVLVLLPADDPIAGEARELACELVSAQMHNARRAGNHELAKVHRRGLVALGRGAAAGTANICDGEERGVGGSGVGARGFPEPGALSLLAF